MLIDFHVHAFPDAVAEKAIPRLSACSGGVIPAYDGKIASLKSHMLENHVDCAVVLNIATNPHQEKKVNDFAISLLGDEMLVPFGRLHPDYQNFYVDEERMFPIYKKIAALGLITVFHAGIDIGYPTPVHCTPQRLLKVLDLFGEAPVIAAHFGGYMLWEEVTKYLCGTQVYFDTAFSYGKIPPDFAREIILSHDPNRILLGSDLPWSTAANEERLIHFLQLDAAVTDAILFNNAKRLLSI